MRICVQIMSTRFDRFTQGDNENLYCESYRGESKEEKKRTKYIWMMRTARFGGRRG